MDSKNHLVYQDGKYYGYDTLGGRLYDLDTVEYIDEEEPGDEDGEEETVNEDISPSSVEAKTVQTQSNTKSK